MDLVGEFKMMSLEFVEARPRFWSRGIVRGFRLQTLDGVDVILLLDIAQRSPGEVGGQ
jgi:hypothetical protein